MLKYYKASDLFVFPTREDIWGLVINEAMSCGLPVITTNSCNAGLALVEDYKNGRIVPVDNTDLLTQSINKFLDNDQLLLDMSINTCKIIQHYSIENMAERHYKIFEEILMLNNEK